MKKQIILLFLFVSINLFGLVCNVEAASCSATKPEKAPELFQIDVTKSTAKLYFTPVNNAITNYTIVYGLTRQGQDFSISFPYGYYDGVIDYTINSLNANTEYFFKVRADNGCRQGKWSNSMAVKTNWDLKIYTKLKSIEEPKKVSNNFKIPSKTEEPLIITQYPEKKVKPSVIPFQNVNKNQKKTNKKINIIDIFQMFIEKINLFINKK